MLLLRESQQGALPLHMSLLKAEYVYKKEESCISNGGEVRFNDDRARLLRVASYCQAEVSPSWKEGAQLI